MATLIIKEELSVSDRACVEQITENPYLQYFCGLKAFVTEPPFDPSMMVHFRKRFPANVLAQVNNAVAQKVREKYPPPEKPDDPPVSRSNKGKLLVAATCTPTDITCPTDVTLLNKARAKSEEIIDIPHKPRTYRQRAHKDLLVISEVFCQQQWMQQHDSERIVSISQPHVRPIKRWKAEAATEFGAKVSISLVDGIGFVDKISWDNFNEGIDLISQIESYHKRFGCYYGLNRVMTKRAHTSETAIMLSFLVMNLKRWLAVCFYFLFQRMRALFVSNLCCTTESFYSNGNPR